MEIQRKAQRAARPGLGKPEHPRQRGNERTRRSREWLTVFQLPACASELNPVESAWSHLKRSLANLAKRDIAQLTALVKTRLRRMQYQPGLIEGFLTGTRPGLTPFCNFRT
jgi:hypothetical protein